MEAVHALTPAVVLLLVGILALMSMRPLGLSPIVGYLIAGLAIGPHALDLVPQNASTHLLAELGVVFLLFDIGLHFSLQRIWEARRDIFGLGPAQIVLSSLALGVLGYGLGIASEFVLVLGGALALSSTAVVVRVLAEKSQQNCPVGRAGTAVLIMQDIAAIFLLVLAASLDAKEGAAGRSSFTAEVFMAVVKAAIAFGLAVAIGRFAIRPAFRLLARSNNNEVFTATALLVVLATASASGAAGLSLTLGAFLGGMMIAETPYRHVIQTEAQPFRDLLLAFFFITVGMSLDWRMLLDGWVLIVTVLAGLAAVKIVTTAVAARIFGWSIPGAVQLGFLLAQGSEFVFVIMAMPSVRNTLGEVAVGVVFTAVAASMALTPFLAGIGNRLARYLRTRSTAGTTIETAPKAATAPVLLFGMDQIGRAVADALEANAVGYDAVEMDHDRFLAAAADGYPVAFGDAGDLRLMNALAMEERSAVVVTVNRYEISKALTPIMRDRYPRLTRFIGVEDETDANRFAMLGMQAVVNRSIPKGVDLAASVLRAQGVTEASIKEWMQRYQDRALEAAMVLSR